MAVKLPENNRHWTTNWEFRVSDKPPTTNVYAGHGDFSATTVELARFVLQNQPEWTRERIEQAMSAGKSRTLRLEEPIPVLITYSTVVVKEDGRVLFFSDIYQQDALLKQALGSARAHTQ